MTMRFFDNRTGLQVLDRAECLRLLSSRQVGRVAVVVGSTPSIFPVNYALDREGIVFRTDEGSKLSGASSGFAMSFEIDEVDDRHREGWSVVVNGVGRRVADLDELDRLDGLELRPWSPGAKAHWVRIHPQTITGRRIVHKPGD